ncbi:MAG: sigma-70 family RNA polymerase sigma factor [Planctomycetaceae bacterium]|nr:sigma-70 family RNA polymerase sigma factor [Planctomycetaceae bacterium]
MTTPSVALETRPSLLMRLRDTSDREAWSEFVDVYSPLVYGFLRRRSLHDSDAADVTQEVFLRVSRSIPTFIYSKEQGRFRDWLWTITRNEIRRFHEKRKRRVAEIQESPDGTLEQLASTGDSAEWNEEFHRHILEVAMKRIEPSFEPQTWQAFCLVWVNQVSAIDAAEQVQQSVDFVYVAKSRVLKRLREEVLVLADHLALSFW